MGAQLRGGGPGGRLEIGAQPQFGGRAWCGTGRLQRFMALLLQPPACDTGGEAVACAVL